MLLPAALWLTALAVMPGTMTAAQTSSGNRSLIATNGTACDCLRINGSVPTYYSNHMFFDFRNLPQYAGVPDLVTDEAAASAAEPSSDYFGADAWTNVWEIQTWDNSNGSSQPLANGGTVPMTNSRSNVYIQKDPDVSGSTFMTLRTSRLPAFQTSAEFQSVDSDFVYASMRMLARTNGASGAVTGMFTYRDVTGKLADVQESDIEMLTRGPRDKIQYTNQPDYTVDGGTIPQATTNASTPNWGNWVVHRLDWTPSTVVWYVDGKETARNSFQTPRDASGLHFSAWSDGGVWSGNMSVGATATQQVRWIEVIYNTTTASGGQKRDTAAGGGGCRVVCSVDEGDGAGPGSLAVVPVGAAGRAEGSRLLVGLALGVVLFQLLV